MENSADALKMVLAIFMFVVALSIVFSQLSKVKETADTVLWYSDKTNYYNWTEGNTLTENGRIVGIETVISTLKNYRKQSAYVIIEDDSGKREFDYSSSMQEEIENFIKAKTGSQDKYLENIREITTGGKYRTADDGTRITIKPGTTRTYVIYTKI